MAKFLVLYNSPHSASEVMANSTPEEQKAGMEAWIQWKDALPGSVKFEFGMPLEARDHLTESENSNNPSSVSGYSFIEGDKAEIVGLLKNHPHLKVEGNSIDLLEVLPMPGLPEA